MHLGKSIGTITNARVLDVDTATISEPTTVTVNGERIAEVGGSGAPTDSETFDAEGRIVSPGLIDAHVHVLAATANLGDLGDQSPYYLGAQAARLMGDMLGRGFTTVRDAGGADFGLAAAVRENLFPAPRLFFGGKALSQTGGHADMRGAGTHVMDKHLCCPNIGIVCDGADAVRKAARENLRTGADHVKIMLSGGVASPTDRVDSTQFSDDEIRAAVEEAAAANRYVLGHAYTAKSVNRGLELGVRSIEHGNLIDRRSVQLLLEKDAFLVPTLVTYERLKQDGATFGLPEASQKKVDDVLYAGLDALKLATEHEVKIAYGSDLLGGMQPHQSQEFAIRAKVQTPQQVLRSATTTAAELLREEDNLGVVARGAFADLLVLNANPLDDVSVLGDADSSIHSVIRGGRLLR
ncbi:MAG: amidohydrolase family protein [Brevibacterium sp.]|uniref:metal-dependent hydrolase family protein n=1 Tax=Brevibacterium sp. TaxID=1701 RepID=UPI0026494045|nr:amidohydrolase family protein [Brevibacterium sp.]MDN5807781.1 amidohydrolase family protein [Brevibacterium sp.]MDN5876421.1 amidohydrolase family protein [Brevibacterium sp.]MDN5909835.1 amidohydrolase family protein [Brevibacterium sp.]MDN6122868.1 amidohydrolase family protein [Brevibacterium sp.]MDN6134899.1 amidohydrolase family protein [Brevibacterium sp.]